MESVSQRGSKEPVKSGGIVASGGLRGAGSSNTHPSKRQKGETGGEDTAHLSLGVKWKGDYDGLFSALEGAKEQAKAAHTMACTAFGGVPMGVHPSGRKIGTVYFPYHVETAGFVVFVKSGSCEETPTAWVEIGSQVLMSCGGLWPAWMEFKNLLEALGGYVMWNKLSRVDLCVDLPGCYVGDIVRLVQGGQAVGRPRKKQYFQDGERWTGVTVGHGDVLVRMYDKAYEVQIARPDPRKQELLESYRWGGPQEKATRVEFQLRREALRSLKINSISDYFIDRVKVLNYLTSDWFRLVASVPDRENHNTTRAEVHPFWDSVCQAFQAWAGTTSEVARRAGRRLFRDPIRLLKQGVGCMMSAVSDLVDGREMPPLEFVDKVRECFEFWLNEMPEHEFRDRYRRKALPVVLAEVAL